MGPRRRELRGAPCRASLSHLLPQHRIDHVGQIGWSGKKDIPLLADAAAEGYDVSLTTDARQLADPDETKAIMRSGIHHVRYSQTVSGLAGAGLSMGAIAAAMPLIMAQLQAAEGQRLVLISRLDHRPNARFEMVDPRKAKPKYWRR